MDTRVKRCLWGEGRGWACVNWKTLQKCKCAKNFVHDCSLRKHSTFHNTTGGFPLEMTSEEGLQKFNTDDTSLHRYG